MTWLRCLILAALAPLCCAEAAHAQVSDTPVQPHAEDQQVLIGDKLPPEHLAGDWDGVRSWLLGQGLDLSLSYESETAGVVSGGKRQGVDYTHSIDLEADLDWGKLAGLSGFSTHLALAERAGRNASADYVGESLTQVQQLYGSGGDVLVHFVYLYAEQKLFGDAVDLAGGRLDLGQDFATSPLYCEFVTLSICPSPRALSIEESFTIYPQSTWGGRARVTPAKPFYVQLGAYQVRPAFGGRSGFDWSTSDTTGAAFPVELGWEPRFGPGRLVGHYKLGLVWDTSDHADLFAGEGGRPLALSGTAEQRRGQALTYALADQMLLRTGPNGTDGVVALAGYIHADAHSSVLNQEAFAGLLANGVVSGRPGDGIGVQATWLQVSPFLTATQELEAGLGQPLTSGVSTIAAAPPGVQGREWVLEARYDVRLRQGVHVLPDLQYVVRPDGASRFPNATVLGVQVTLDF